jgi:glycosyltransferase involved in cell wall biosynthesis
MPFFNAAPFIAEAVDSLVQQTCVDWELLLVDDGSSDGSARIVAAYAERMPDRVRFLRHADGGNHGIAASRNLAIRHARGRYLANLDADDVWEPERLARHMAVLETHPAVDVVISSELYWYSWAPGNEAGLLRDRDRDRVRGPYAIPDRPIPPPVLFASWILTRGAVVPSQDSVTYRKAALDAVGPVPDEAGNHYEDQVLYAKLLLSRTCYVLTDCLARYRQHPASVTRGNTFEATELDGNRLPPRLRYFRWLRDYLAEIDTGVPELRARVDEEIARLQSPPAGSQPRSMASRLGLVRWAESALPPRLVEVLRQRSEASNEARVRRRAIRCAGAIERRVLARGRETPGRERLQ